MLSCANVMTVFGAMHSFICFLYIGPTDHKITLKVIFGAEMILFVLSRIQRVVK